jgi:hypothetical protein
MSDRALLAPLEIGFTRRVLVAVEVVDGVTLTPVRIGIKVSATGLTRRPIVNASGFHVWVEEGDRQAREIVVDAQGSPYQSVRAQPVAPPGHRRIELPPTPGYRFPPGVTALRGTLRERLYGPPAPVEGALVRLQWYDDAGWNDAPLASASAANGDFAAALRLAPTAEARTGPNGDFTVRLSFTRDGRTRFSDEMPLRPGAVGAAAQPFIWDELLP